MDDKRVDERPDGAQGNTTYTAWDGAERPWPPPENWYRAVDGRWWHPAYGPDEPPDSLPVWDASDPSTDLAGSEPPLKARVERNPEPEPERDPEPQSETTIEVEAEQRSARRPWAMGALIAVGVLGVAAVAQIVSGGSDDGRVDTDREPAGAMASDDVEGAFDAEGDREPAAGSDPDVAAGVADFRRVMSDNGLSTEELTDDQITTFASTFCVFAAGAGDRATFDELRLIAVTNSRSDLTPTQLDLTITTAVTVFCPAESDRLGIGSDQSEP